MIKNTLYEQLTVIKMDENKPNVLIKFIVLYDRSKEKYTVVCTNYFYENTTIEQYMQFEKQTTALLIGFPPAERNDWYDSLEEAIEQHIREFNEE